MAPGLLRWRSSNITRLSFIRRNSTYVLLIAWLAAVGAGWWCISAYQFASEQPTGNFLSVHWPVQATIARAERGFTLVAFFHPKCPCSRATVAELERLLARIEGRGQALPKLYLLATIPGGEDRSWAETTTIRRAARLPRATVVVDPGGRDAALFGATTSGAVMLFDSTGQRLYGGGITMARAMEGSNTGSAAVESALAGGTPAVEGIPVFGCRLCLPEDQPVEGRRDTAAIPSPRIEKALAVAREAPPVSRGSSNP